MAVTGPHEAAIVEAALRSLVPSVPASWHMSVAYVPLLPDQPDGDWTWRFTVTLGCAATAHGRRTVQHTLVVDWQSPPADVEAHALQVMTSALHAANGLPGRLHAAVARWN